MEAKRKRTKKRPQPRHKVKHQASQHDKRKRLQQPNPNRRKTTQAKFPLCGTFLTLATALRGVLDRRIAFRLPIILAGMLLAAGRCTASCWFAAAGVLDDWDQFYDCLIHVLIPTETENVYLVIVVVVFSKDVFGHHVLNLNEKYGLTTPDRE